MVCSGSAKLVSFPLESDSIMVRIGRELKKLKAREESSTSAAESISIGLSGIADLYKCICEMLSLPLTKKALREKCVVELLGVSSKLLEICSATQEITMQMKESSRGLRSALDATLKGHESSISSYICSRKKIMKRTKETLLSLKGIDGERFVFFGLCGDHVDERISVMIQALRCISVISISIHENLLLFLGTKPKFRGKKSLFSKLIRRGKSACEGDEVSRNELENVDVALCGLSAERDEKTRLACKRLEALEGGIEGIESGLESVFMELTQTRVLLKHAFKFGY